MDTVRFASAWKRRRERNQIRRQALARKAREDLQQIVRILACEYDAERIILFGSLLGDRFAPDSDIDVAVEGLTPEHFYEALAAVNRVTSQWVDLKPLEDLDTLLKRRILQEGNVLFTRRDEDEVDSTG